MTPIPSELLAAGSPQLAPSADLADLIAILRAVEPPDHVQGAVRDRRANWQQSLGVLRAAKAAGVRLTKTSIMLGVGETPDEVVAALKELRCVVCVWLCRRVPRVVG